MNRILALLFVAALAGCDQPAVPATAAPAANAAPAPRLTWNMDDANAMTNGNIALAASKYAKGESMPDGNADIAAVMKAPWNYYGQRLCFPALVANATDMPPGSAVAKALHGAGEILAVTDSGEILDMITVGSTGTIQANQRLDICGLVVGRAEVPNAIGGTFTQLVMVGKLKPPA